jgi:DTW domain-containing protein YfiP
MNRPAARAVCDRCRRPSVVCWCAHLPRLPSKTRVLVLQHPRESRVGIGTARMAHLALPNSCLRIGVDFSRDPVVAATLAESGDCYLLFPGPQARDIRTLEPSPARPITLVVVDGTWSQARTLVRLNPALASLPRLAFTPQRPSDYRIRREPTDFCVSTIEALAEALNVLEASPQLGTSSAPLADELFGLRSPNGAPFDPLLAPFRVMVDKQEWYANEVRSSRHQRRHRAPSRPSLTLGARLAAEWQRLVCVQGEANGWPIHHPDRRDPELVHFVAWRAATGERYQALLRPRGPLAPLTTEHLGLSAERLAGGVSVDAFAESWRAFARPDDVIVHWGSFQLALAAADGLALPPRRFDLRGELTQSGLRPPCGTLEGCVAGLNGPRASLGLDGRGGRRLDALVTLVHELIARA